MLRHSHAGSQPVQQFIRAGKIQPAVPQDWKFGDELALQRMLAARKVKRDAFGAPSARKSRPSTIGG
jgi:hypothetical protein